MKGKMTIVHQCGIEVELTLIILRMPKSLSGESQRVITLQRRAQGEWIAQDLLVISLSLSPKAMNGSNSS